MRFSSIVMSYLIIGVVMFGGGAVALDDAGVANWFVEGDNGSFVPSTNSMSNAQGIGGAISSVVSLAVGTVLLVWNLAIGLIAYLNWPLIVLYSNNTPPMMVLLLGGGYTAAFYLSLIRLVKTSA